MTTRKARSWLLLVGLGLAACTERGGSRADAGPDEPTIVEPDGYVVVQLERIESGPRISGSLEARRHAVLRAETAGSVERVAAELGDRVKRGQVLARIEDRTLRDAVASARSAVTSAREQEVVARRQLERSRRLERAGAIALRDLEVVAASAAAAEAQHADARWRLTTALNALQDATVRAPFAGVVSERHVSTGDIVAPGSALFTVIDPSTMRLTASVPSEEVSAMAVGKAATFTVRGYPGEKFTGSIERTSPMADPSTRQLTVLVALPNPGGRLIEGLFAEGRVAAASHDGVVVPLTAVELSGATPRVLRVRDGVVEDVAVTLGLRDEQRERIEITSGLAPGDAVLVGGARSLLPGTSVTLEGAAGAPAVGR